MQKLSQSQIKDLFFDTIVEASTKGRGKSVCFVTETETFYRYLKNSTFPIDNQSVLQAFEGRWIAISGKYGFGGGGGTSCCSIFVTDATSAGIVGDKIFNTETIPTSKVLESCTLDGSTITIHFEVEGGSDNYSPIVIIDSIVCTNLQQFSDDRRIFFGSVDVTVSISKTIAIESSTGASTSITINKAEPPPTIVDLRFLNGYPGIQTEVKENDTFDIEVTFDPLGTEPAFVTIYNFGACKYQDVELSTTELNWGTVHKATITSVIDNTSSTPTLLPCKVSTRNQLGSESNQISSDSFGSVDGTNLVLCDDSIPTFADNGITFPAGQLAFKGMEIGSQDTLIQNFTDILYDSPTGDFAINSPNVYEQDKIIICSNPGSYNDNSVNFEIIATKTTNGTSATFNKVIEVADIAPVLDIIQPYARLRSSPLGFSYIITASSNQNMSGFPDVNIPVSGTWEGLSFVDGLKTFHRNINIKDIDIKGSGNWTLNSPFYNRAEIPATIGGTQVVGGFQPRDLVLEAFKNEISVDVEVVDYTKLKIGSWDFTGDALLLSATINDVPPVPGYFTIDVIGISPHVFRVLDTNKTLASSQATMIYDYEEEV